jgi:hypothetical protein
MLKHWAEFSGVVLNFIILTSHADFSRFSLKHICTHTHLWYTLKSSKFVWRVDAEQNNDILRLPFTVIRDWYGDGMHVCPCVRLCVWACFVSLCHRSHKCLMMETWRVFELEVYSVSPWLIPSENLNALSHHEKLDCIHWYDSDSKPKGSLS